MKIILTDDDGVLLDQTEVTRSEYEQAHNNDKLAAAIFHSLDAGKEAQ